MRSILRNVVARTFQSREKMSLISSEKTSVELFERVVMRVLSKDKAQARAIGQFTTANARRSSDDFAKKFLDDMKYSYPDSDIVKRARELYDLGNYTEIKNVLTSLPASLTLSR